MFDNCSTKGIFMDERQIHALLGQWYDIQIGRAPFGRRTAAPPGTVPWAHRHHRRHRFDDQSDQGDQFGYGEDGGYAQPEQYPMPQYPMPQYPMPQYPMPMQYPVPVPTPIPTPVPVPAPGAPSPAVSGWYGTDAGCFWPRAAVVDAPPPTEANRDILPMSTGVPILPTQSAQITGRPQTLVYKIGRFVISNAGTAGGAADWIVNDIKIGNRSQFVQSGDVPGDMFATNAIDTFVRFASAQTAMDVVVVVTYIGLNESGCPFFGAMVGTAAV
jgi:hypothetical protein